MFEAVFVFQDALQRAREPLTRTYQEVMSQALKEHKDAFLQEVAKEKALRDASTPGHGSFRVGSQRSGSRSAWDNSVRCRKTVGMLRANTF